MNISRKWKRASVLVLLMLAAFWVLPPLHHATLHYCPLRPSVVPEAAAIPAFARQFGMSCMKCHEMAPRLNSAGEAFRLNGFRWPGTETVPGKDKEAPKSGPNPLYKKIFPNASWPNELSGSGVPLSLRVIPSFTKTSGPGGRSNEWEGEIQTGGTINEMLSFFGHINLKSQSAADTKTANSTSVFMFLNVENLVRSNHLLNLQFGMVGSEEADYFHYRNHSTDALAPGSQRPFSKLQVIPYPAGFEKPNLFKLFRGPGAMVWGTTPRSSYSVGYREGDQDGGGSSMNVGFFHWAYKLGGMDHGLQTKDDFPEDYMENSLSFGVLGDIGSARVRPTPASTTSLDTFWRAGGDMRVKHRAWTARAGGIVGANNNPYGSLDQGRAKTSTWFAETDYHWVPALLTELRYEEEYISVPAALNLGKTNRGRWVPLVAVLAAPNVRFQLSGDLYSDPRKDKTGAKLDSDAVTFLIDYAF